MLNSNEILDEIDDIISDFEYDERTVLKYQNDVLDHYISKAITRDVMKNVMSFYNKVLVDLRKALVEAKKYRKELSWNKNES